MNFGLKNTWKLTLKLWKALRQIAHLPTIEIPVLNFGFKLTTLTAGIPDRGKKNTGAQITHTWLAAGGRSGTIAFCIGSNSIKTGLLCD